MMTYARVDLSKYIVISIWFGCNNNCTICMLSDMKRELSPIGFDKFKKVLIDIRNEGRFENLILSGGEVTTFDDLDKYIQYTESLGWCLSGTSLRLVPMDSVETEASVRATM